MNIAVLANTAFVQMQTAHWVQFFVYPFSFMLVKDISDAKYGEKFLPQAMSMWNSSGRSRFE